MTRSVSALGIVLCCGFAANAYAQPSRFRSVPLKKAAAAIDSGPVANPADRRRVVYTTTLFSPGAAWVRLRFDDVRLTGDPETESASQLILTSLADGATQRLNAVHLREWGNTSAYFNGDAVRVDLVASPGPGQNRVAVAGLLTGGPGPSGTDSLCGPGDDRVLSADGRVARVLTPVGGGTVCTAFIISDSARCMLSAGQCAPGAGALVEFNVPLSSAGGVLAHPPPHDQYAIDPSSVQSAGTGPGNNWAYFGVFANPNTGLGAASAQGSSLPLIASPAPASQTVLLTGYGSVSAPVPLSRNVAQKAGIGPYTGLAGSTIQHQVDTTPGDAGAPITLTGSAIGINDGDGCIDPPGSSFNTGTASQNPGLQAALAAPTGLCTATAGPADPPIYLATDPAGNLVTIGRSTGGMGFVGQTTIAGQVNGLAYDRGRGRFYASEFMNGGPDQLYILDESTGAATLVGAMAGPPDVSGLAFDANSDTLYGIDEASGQLYTISFITAAATPIGSPGGPGVGGIEYDPALRQLYGLDDTAPGTRLVGIDTSSGTRSVIGALGTGITDCDGLAYSPDDRSLYTVDQSSGTAYRIDPASGAATAVGTAGAVRGVGFGMACSYVCAPPCIPNAPLPMQNAQQVWIGDNITWLGCPNGKVFGVDSNPALGINFLYDILTGTGGGTIIGPTTPGSQQITGLVWNGQAMFGIDLSTGNLLRVNTTTGAPTPAGATGVTGWQDLASDATDNGQLYGITQTNRLYRLSITGVPVQVALNVGSLVTAMAFDRTGQLWGIEFASGRVLRINKTSGVITPTSVTIAGFQGLDFDDAGVAYAHNSGTDSLYTVNLQTGMATLRGLSGTDSVKSLAFGMSTDFGGLQSPPPPEPRGPMASLPPVVNLTDLTPVSINSDLIIDQDHHGLPDGVVAVRGTLYPRGAEPWMPPTPPPEGGPDSLCGGTMVTFDDLAAPCSFGLTTRLLHEYETRGVIFEGPGGANGGAVLNSCANLGITGISGANVLAFDPGATLADGGQPAGPESLRFPEQVSSVQVSIASALPGLVTLQAYRGSVLVASRNAPLSTTMTPVSVFANGITRVVISSTAPYAIDDLCFVPSCPTTYDIYFSTNDPPMTLLAANSPNTVFDPGSLASTTVYFWRIVAKNCCGVTEGPTWRFVTLCYPNCDRSTTVPFLNVLDFGCFLNAFATGDTYANCDDSTTPPVLNVQDFACFLNKFAAGCPQ